MTLAATARSAAIGATLALGACADAREAGREIVWESDRVVPAATAQSAAAGPPGTEGDLCREYTQTIRIGNEEHQAFGRACPQPDGSWQLHPPPAAPGTQAVPPPRVRAVPVYPAYYPPPYYYAPPPFFGSAFFFSKHHHHKHHHHHHGHRHSRHGHRR